jgi:hypothetical protein
MKRKRHTGTLSLELGRWLNRDPAGTRPASHGPDSPLRLLPHALQRGSHTTPSDTPTNEGSPPSVRDARRTFPFAKGSRRGVKARREAANSHLRRVNGANPGTKAHFRGAKARRPGSSARRPAAKARFRRTRSATRCHRLHADPAALPAHRRRWACDLRRLTADPPGLFADRGSLAAHRRCLAAQRGGLAAHPRGSNAPGTGCACRDPTQRPENRIGSPSPGTRPARAAILGRSIKRPCRRGAGSTAKGSDTATER